MNSINSINYMNNNIAVPPHISKIGVYTCHSFVVNALAAYYYKLYTLFILLLLLYITSFLHWKNMKKDGIIRNVDIITSIATIIKITKYDSYHFESKRWIWLITISLSVFTFIINNMLFYNQVLKFSDKIIEYPEKVQHTIFSLVYTNPNTNEREKAYYRSVIIHCISIHFIPSIACIYAAITGIKNY